MVHCGAVNLSLRLLLAFCCVALLATAMAGFLVRMQWRRSERERFDAQVVSARDGVSAQIQDERQAIEDILHPLCKHDAFVDRTVVDLKAGHLDSGRRLAIAELTREEMKALRLDELVLVTDDGQVLGAGHDRSLIGTYRPDLGAMLNTQQPQSLLRPPAQTTPPVTAALVGICVSGSDTRKVGLIGARHVAPMLTRLGSAFGVRLALIGEDKSELGPHDIAQEITVGERGQFRVLVISSRKNLEHDLHLLDRSVLMAGAITLAVAILLAIVLARSIAKPLAALAKEVGEVVDGEPRKLRPRGTTEMRQLANAFNKTLNDLVALRKRHATIERIAAWREVARRVAHEIKNPLTPIRSSVETLCRLKDRNDPMFDEYFEEATAGILQSVHRITTIASDFARFARLPAPSPTLTDVAQAVRSVVVMHQPADVSVTFESEGNPQAWVDRVQLGQVVTNLVQNAIDAVKLRHAEPHGHQDPPSVRVRVGPWQDDHVRLVVDDNGPGVPPSVVNHLFEPYTTTKAHGTGLGLPIVQHICFEHGGEIAYEPNETGGSRFVVTLPVRPSSLLPNEPPIQPSPTNEVP